MPPLLSALKGISFVVCIILLINKNVKEIIKNILFPKNEILNSTTTFGGGIYSRTVKVYSFI